MNTFYILKDKIAYSCSDIHEWGKFMEGKGNRIVRQTTIEEQHLLVSTVFLGIDYNFRQSGDPLLFETMVFCTADKGFDSVDFKLGNPRDSFWGSAIRDSFYQEAELTHNKVLDAIKAQIAESEEKARNLLYGVVVEQSSEST